MFVVIGQLRTNLQNAMLFKKVLKQNTLSLLKAFDQSYFLMDASFCSQLLHCTQKGACFS